MSKIKKKKISGLVDVFNNIRVPLSSKQREKLKKIYPYYGAQNIVDHVDDFLFDGEYILIAEDGENLRSKNQNICNLVNGKFRINNHAHIIRGNKENITKYLFYRFNKINFEPYITGSAQPKLNKENLLNIELFLHDNKEDQQNIASMLSALDTKIALNNKINAGLEAMAKTLYDYWFVQFDFPDENGKPYKSSGGEMAWSEELKREIPKGKGWDVDMINTKVKIGSGFPFDSNEYYNNGNYKIITIKNVQDGNLDTNSADKIDYIPEKIASFCILGIGDILMSLTGNVGRMCFVDQEKLLLNQRVGKLIGDKDFVIYTYLFFQRPENQARLNKIAGGSSQANLSPIDTVKDYFVIPSQKILDSFSKTITPIFDQIINNRQESQKLAELRDWLLPMLMNGQVVVG